MRNKIAAMVLTGMMVIGLAGCGSTGSSSAASSSASSETAAEDTSEKTEIQVFIAARLSKVMEEVAEKYNEEHPEVTITYNADSSGTLLTQIEEGYACDVFFSAARKRMYLKIRSIWRWQNSQDAKTSPKQSGSTTTPSGQETGASPSKPAGNCRSASAGSDTGHTNFFRSGERRRRTASLR